MIILTFLLFMTLCLSFYLRKEGYSSIIPRLYTLTLSLAISWVFLEMTHPSEVMLKSYYTISKIASFKWFNGTLYALIITIIFYLYESILHAFGFEMIDPWILLHLLTDIVLILVFTLPLIYLKHQSLGFIPAILYIVFQYFSDQFDSLTLYHIIPFYQPMILTYRLAIIYKLCYISLGYLLCLPKR
ncbi:MAG TPA: hypothetical protein DEA30_06040 [Acholeplasmataceae bacterium]|nr:MAG: hypothetical protein A2Z84_01460 [Tenericutes bacterium GWA2_35_7]OHE35931.1 MAG: hypothetical protein A2Y46_03340 [Tenericutes bacterium GWF1_35_14]OHE42950.1 MAG: hypothetical protein A2221_09645 [Tenericutes bacterium RIFOXYA2_FULL_36_32]OHE50275.1 MAG: hypothetical protein A2518_08820 [Tenericutes bacterium RIFOXYD12_FULL_36_9]OHE50892.1 MAG: hypothetical protein A2449_01130 [Tenericutes bacterium RIFOXYC2_FULL_35_27]HAX03284.1 hypothetical protein [Acholeplasmataceae bacterium]